MQAEPVSNGVMEDVTEAGHQIMRPNNEEVIPSRLNGRLADLSLQIPPKPPSFGSSHRGKDILQHQGSFKGSSALGSFLRGLSFKHKVASSNGEGSSLLEVPGSPVLDESIISSLSWKGCVSLPVTPASHLSPSTPAPLKERMILHNQAPYSAPLPVKVSRSLSVPGRKKVVVVRSLSFAARTGPAQTEPTDDHTSPVHMENDDEVIPEEEAVCRICLIELSEGGNIFKMECSCKGDLKLTHEECVVKWFCIKGNKNCDVCGQEVRNLPVAVLRKHSAVQREYRHGRNSQNPNMPMMSAWYDLVVLTLISSISYFFILEQLLIQEMKSQAIIVAAPFSFTLGLLGSMFAIIVANKEYIWSYAAIEFILVAMILHLCYNTLHLHAIYSVLLSTVAGFGLAISINSLCVCIFAWRSEVTDDDRIDSNPV